MHVVIAGGGVAGLEAMLALAALAEGQVEVELICPSEEFVYRPMLVAEPFGSSELLTIPLRQLVGEAGASHRRDSLVSVDPAGRTVTTAAGEEIAYDALLVALGASPIEAVAGALTFSGAEERKRFAELLGRLGRRGLRRLAFVVPRAATWSIAAYELALLTAAERDARRLPEVEITLVTHEEAPLDLFGSSAARLVADRLGQAGIALEPSSRAERFEDGLLHRSGASPLPFDAAVSLPALEVGPLPGLPQRRNGFLQTDTGMNVAGLQSVWAAGDATWFPVKQGGLAAQQADVAARAIAARAGVHAPLQPFQPVLRAALITGDSPEFLRSPLGGRGADAAAAGRALWWPPTKLAGRYLGPRIAHALGEESGEELVDLDPAAAPAADEAKHRRAVSLLLATADGDARIGDFEGALKWLSLVEQLNLVIPPEYVARRHQWRQQRGRGADAPPNAAAERIDPSFASAAAALSDLQRRLGWMREIEHRNEGEMREHLDGLDADMDHLLALSRRSGALRAGR